MISNGERLTSQRKVILEYLQSVHSHPTAEEVWLAVKERLPQISLATVYRNLEWLKEKGKIREIEGRVARFDADLSSHCHFVCRRCGRVFDVWREPRVFKRQMIGVGRIEKQEVYLYGVCQSCLRKEAIMACKKGKKKKKK